MPESLQFLLLLLLGLVLGWLLGRWIPRGPSRVPPGPKVVAIEHLNGVVTVDVEFEPVALETFKVSPSNYILVANKDADVVAYIKVTEPDIGRLNGDKVKIKRKVPLLLEAGVTWPFAKGSQVTVQPVLLFGKPKELGRVVGDQTVISHG